MDERNKREPLLYIQQPEYKKPTANMQTIYKSQDQEKEVVEKEAEKLEEKKIRKKKVQDHSSEHKNIEVDVEEFLQNNNEHSPTNKQSISSADYFRKQSASKKSWRLTPVKSFREMSIPEKIQYLQSFPPGQPPFPCEFSTEKEKIRGTFYSHSNGVLCIQTFNQEKIEVPVRELQVIKIIY